jgi:dTMP kinase
VFISLEGPDGVGKTTQVGLLADRLRRLGLDPVLCREPGGTGLGERIRALVLEHEEFTVADRAEALLFAAARAQIVEEVVRPALDAGRWVVSDRFIDSSIVYQGVARGLGVDPIREVSLFATDGLLPHRTLVLRGARFGIEAPDRIEAEGGDFQDRVAAGFDAVLGLDPARLRAVDAVGTPDEVAERVWAALEDLVP